jgi:predicted hotdog family 3-hydroxylacyl-ACP dehydratase
LDRRWIERSLPQRGRMCLLDAVLEWDAHRIVCRSGSHRAADHPLRSGDRLGIACAIEYAAQAMALHGVLAAAPTTASTATVAADPAVAADPRPPAGFLASVRDVYFGAARIDDIGADLLCTARRLAGDGGTVIYEFEVAADGSSSKDSHCLVGGRATIVLQSGPSNGPAEK